MQPLSLFHRKLHRICRLQNPKRGIQHLSLMSRLGFVATGFEPSWPLLSRTSSRTGYVDWESFRTSVRHQSAPARSPTESGHRSTSGSVGVASTGGLSLEPAVFHTRLRHRWRIDFVVCFRGQRPFSLLPCLCGRLLCDPAVSKNARANRRFVRTFQTSQSMCRQDKRSSESRLKSPHRLLGTIGVAGWVGLSEPFVS